jgi:histidyl-tRNA synthetase
MQFDADTVGSASMAADAEMAMMAADTMEALGIPRGSYVVKVNNRKVLDGVLESLDLSGDANAWRRLTVLRAIDKLDRVGVEGVRQLLGSGRKDESGDFTKGAGLDDDQIAALITTLVGRSSWSSIRDDTEFPTDDEWIVQKEFLFPDWRTAPIPNLAERHFYNNRNLIEGWPRTVSDTDSGAKALQELGAMLDLFQANGFGSNRIRISLDVVRGLEYYTGPIYEVELLIDTKDEHGRPVRFGSVGGGGRYDGLVSRFRGEPVPATGFSIGVSRLLAALTLLGKVDDKAEAGPIVVTVFDQDRIAEYQRMVQALREANIRAELYLGSGKMGQQLKYADKRRSPCVVIQGGNEKEKGEVQIKDLLLGAELAGLSKDHDDYRRKQAEAQFAVSEADLVAGVRKVLARHGVGWG